MQSDTSDFARIEEALAREGPGAALEALCQVLERERKLPHLFEAMLMRSRVALGLPLIPLSPVSDLPREVLEPHEEAIAQACRKVGGLYLEEGDIAAAWPYFRALGETAPVAAALARLEPGARRKDLEELIDIAVHQGVNPPRGLEMVLASSGICSAITAMERSLPSSPEIGEQCAGVLVRAMHRELVASVKADLARRSPSPGAPPASESLSELTAERPWLFEDANYHADPSHISSVVRLSSGACRGKDLELVLELAEYGRRLASIYHYKSDPPFEDFYSDHALYVRGRLSPGSEDSALAAHHFVAKVRGARARGDRDYPLGPILEVLFRLGRAREAVDLLLELEGGQPPPGCPSLGELCQRAGDFERLARVSREKGDLLGFAAGAIQAARK